MNQDKMVSTEEFIKIIGYSIRGFYKLKKRGLIPDPDGKFPYSKALSWKRKTVDMVAEMIISNKNSSR